MLFRARAPAVHTDRINGRVGGARINLVNWKRAIAEAAAATATTSAYLKGIRRERTRISVRAPTDLVASPRPEGFYYIDFVCTLRCQADMSQQLCEYHYKHREVRVERNFPLYPSAPPVPPPPPPPPPAVHYVRVEVEPRYPPPPPKKKVVFIEVQKPPPPPKEKIVYIKVESPPPLLPRPRPLYEEIMTMMKSVIPQPETSTTETKVIRLTSDQEAVLLEQFNRWPKNPHKADVVLLAAETGLSEEDVQDWYSYKLAQLRKEEGLGNYGFGHNY